MIGERKIVWSVRVVRDGFISLTPDWEGRGSTPEEALEALKARLENVKTGASEASRLLGAE